MPGFLGKQVPLEGKKGEGAGGVGVGGPADDAVKERGQTEHQVARVPDCSPVLRKLGSP